MTISALETMAQVLVGLIIAFVIEARQFLRDLDRRPGATLRFRTAQVRVALGYALGEVVGLGLCVAWMAADREPPKWIASVIVLAVFVGAWGSVVAPAIRLFGSVLDFLDEPADAAVERRRTEDRAWWLSGGIVASLCVLALVLLWLQ